MPQHSLGAEPTSKASGRSFQARLNVIRWGRQRRGRHRRYWLQFRAAERTLPVPRAVQDALHPQVSRSLCAPSRSADRALIREADPQPRRLCHVRLELFAGTSQEDASTRSHRAHQQAAWAKSAHARVEPSPVFKEVELEVAEPSAHAKPGPRCVLPQRQGQGAGEHGVIRPPPMPDLHRHAQERLCTGHTPGIIPSRLPAAQRRRKQVRRRRAFHWRARRIRKRASHRKSKG